jgi:rsbT co-antagonist protein RsbR
VEEITKYNSNDALISVSSKLFTLLSDRLEMNTAYIAKKDGSQMKVLNAFNKDQNDIMVTNDMVVSYQESNCKNIMESKNHIRFYTNLMTNPETKDREITSQLQAKAFLGVVLYSSTGKEFGTLCVADRNDREFSEEEIEYMKTFGSVLSYIIELDETYEDIGMLSAPIIPISDDIAILALQGHLGHTRGLKIIERSLDYTTEKKVRHLIIDLSEIKNNYEEFSYSISSLITSLNLMGVNVMLSGISPELAVQFTHSSSTEITAFQYVRSTKDALYKLGYELKEKN